MKFEKDILYIWVGGSCDYGHKERAGGGAYIAEIYDELLSSLSNDARCSLSNKSHGSSRDQSAKVIDTYTTADFNTKEFQMIYRAMDHALEKFNEQSSTKPDTPAQQAQFPHKIVFLSNVQYIQNYPKHENVEVRILPYHKFSQQKQVHDLASEAMRKLRNDKVQP